MSNIKKIPTKKLVLLLIGNTVLMMALYFAGTVFYPVETLIVFTVFSASFLFAYVIYNRGFSRRNVTRDMLPMDWSEEKKTEFIESGKVRIEKSKWMLTVIFPAIIIYGYEVLDLYIIPSILNIIGKQ